MRSIQAVFAALMLVAGSASARAEDAAPAYKVGDSVEDLALTARDGQTVGLHSFAGKVVLINFWASW